MKSSITLFLLSNTEKICLHGFLKVGEGANAEIIRNYIKRQGLKEGQLKIIDFTAEP